VLDSAPTALAESAALSARRLGFSRGGRAIFQDLDFSLRPGELLQVLGSNGSGKTSLLRVVGGLLLPDEGQLHWHGVALRAADPEFLAAVAYVGHANGIDADLSAAENLRFAMRLAGGAASPQRIAEALRAQGLDARSDAPVRTLSQGQRRRVALARLSLLRRPVWLLDEPSSALDAVFREHFHVQLQAHLNAGGMAVVATHEPLSEATQSLRLEG
jgi:heme exporter protein A